MSKPLTIKELKALPLGEWVWIVDKETPQHTGYYKIDLFAVSHLHLVQGLSKAVIPFSTYGTEWFAYKNKEEAEGKYDIAKYKEFYELVKSYYKDLDDLAKRIQDDLAAGESHKPFQVEETDELALCYILDKVDEMEVEE